MLEFDFLLLDVNDRVCGRAKRACENELEALNIAYTLNAARSVEVNCNGKLVGRVNRANGRRESR